MRTKSCLLGNNKIQRFAFDMFQPTHVDTWENNSNNFYNK